MKLHSPTEHAIYAAAYVARLRDECRDAMRPPHFTVDEWRARAADLAIASAEDAVTLHRDAVRRRRS